MDLFEIKWEYDGAVRQIFIDFKKAYVSNVMLAEGTKKHSIKIANRSFEDVTEFKYLGTTLDVKIVCTKRLSADQIRGMLATIRSSHLSSRLLSRNIKVKIYKTIILPVVFYGRETRSLTLREHNRVRVSENKILRRIFGPKRDEVTGEWRKLHNEELHDLYSSPDIIRQIKSRRMRWAGHMARMEGDESVQGFGGKS
jgi:hypothetical protein